MGATYTRQSSSGIVDGGVIEATDLNNEFDQLLAAFAVSTGHTHDGTAAEGGPITKLLGTAITIGDGTSGTDIAVTFDGESADGVLTWMEDEDYFKFSDDILVDSAEKVLFRDSAIYIHSSADGQLDLVADTEIQIAATTVDLNGNLDVSGTLKHLINYYNHRINGQIGYIGWSKGGISSLSLRSKKIYDKYGDKFLNKIELTNIVLETDSPYLAPHPNRGKRNESAFIINVAQKLSEIYKTSVDDIINITTNNSIDVFKI